TLLVNPELAYQMVLFYANELRDAESGMRNMVHMDVKSRIADALLKMEEHFGTDDSGYIRCQLTRQDIASFSGTTYETLFKVLHDFTSENIVSSEGKRIRILRKEKLRQWVRIPECKNPEQGPRDLQSTEELNG
ncbi:MAG TPA: Crp/Fnr family transcriptional regulator, partial [Puia sp.]|nr:Crp/Fnr family transcriptional regulator [Puia sp.]